MDSRNIIQNVLDYIDENIKSEISNNDLCNIAGYSYIHLARLFKLYLGVTPIEYILKRRLLYAVYEMNGDLSKTDIAFEFGFDTYSGFYKAFKREFSCSPSKFTKSYIGNKPYKSNILQEEHVMVSKTKIQKILPNWNLQNSVVKPIINENTGNKSDNSYYIGDDYVMKYSTNFAAVKKNILLSEIVKLNNNDDYLQCGELNENSTVKKYLTVQNEFFATVQNKLHFAVHEQTAAEVIYNRVDNEKPFVGRLILRAIM